MLARNSKLGSKIWTFDLPAQKTCPDSTEACRSVCYASLGRYRTHRVRRRMEASLKASRKAVFADIVVGLVEGQGAEVVRVHAAGDYYSPAYARKWLAVMRALPGVRFYFYTRAWRRRATRAVLLRMAKLPNVRVWFSADRDTGMPARKLIPAGVRVAYLQLAAADVPPAGCDLVFRASRLRRIPAASVPDLAGRAVPVCPTETGLSGSDKVTCGTCGACWRGEPGYERGRTALPVVA